ncbi:hypothetical protein I4U23_017505 [Adineta vaga]|nr:hypothetical protein I4U23_017505 [Adineta vaga]
MFILQGGKIRTEVINKRRVIYSILLSHHAANEWLVSSTEFFIDAYDVFVINLISSMLGYVYYQHQINLVPSAIQGVLKGITNAGSLFGQILFGILGNSKGRKSIYGIELLVIIIASLGSAMAGSTATGVGALGFLGFWCFLLGIGIGGDYPMSATVSSEGHRG